MQLNSEPLIWFRTVEVIFLNPLRTLLWRFAAGSFMPGLYKFSIAVPNPAHSKKPPHTSPSGFFIFLVLIIGSALGEWANYTDRIRLHKRPVTKK